jgi:carbon monoxide dehydrogenase subunit G
MKVEGTKQLSAPRERVWSVLNDPARMAKLMPGVESFDVIDDRRWRANVKIPLGLGGLRMSIDMEKIEEREPEFARLHAKGNGVGALLDMQTSFRLSEGAAGTDMRWEADVKIAGTIASMGQRVIQPIVNQQVSSVLAALEREVEMTQDGELLDAGPPAESTPDADPASVEGSSGADEGINPWHPETYEPEPEGPTTSTEDPRH